MRALATSLALLLALGSTSGCRLLALGVACERDENCRDDERCVEGLCVRTDPTQTRLHPDGGPVLECPQPTDPESERLVLDEPLVIDSADALAALEGVVVVEGDVRVTSGAPASLSLAELVEVSGTLAFEPHGEGSAPTRVSLPCLARVGGDLILDHGAAASFDLTSLTRVEGSLTLRSGYESVPLPTLAFVGEDLVLEELRVRDLAELSSLTALGGLVARANARLTALTGLEAVTSLTRGLTVEENPALTSLEGLEGLTDLGGTFVIERNAALPTCEAELLRDRLVDHGFRGATRLTANDDGAACAWFENAPCPPVLAPVSCPADADDLNLFSDEDVSAAQDVSCAGNVVIAPSVTSVCLPALVEVSGGLTLGDGNTATHVELPALRKAGALYGSGASLSSLSLPRLESVGGIELFSLPVIERVYLPRLRTVIGNLQLRDMTTAYAYFPELRAITGQLRVIRVEGPTDVSAPALEDVNGVVALRENPTLTGIRGLASLRQTGGLAFVKNEALLDVAGTRLEAVLGDISIDDNARLGSVSGIDPSLTFSGNVVNVRDNPCLPDEDALFWAEAISPGAHNVSGNGTGECP